MMTTTPVVACPPGHTAYPSQVVAENAVELHRWAHPYCHGFHTWPCAEHWHAGHASGKAGRECKQHPTHRAMRKRILLANQIGRWR